MSELKETTTRLDKVIQRLKMSNVGRCYHVEANEDTLKSCCACAEASLKR